MDGKNKCRILKQIRAEIAEKNHIEYVTAECKFQGNCSGTCPKCEAEVRYLEQELEKRQALGKRLVLAGVAAALVVTATGCNLPETPAVAGDVAYAETTEEATEKTTEETRNRLLVAGEVPYEEPIEGEAVDSSQLTGRVDPDLMGDVAWPQ